MLDEPAVKRILLAWLKTHGWRVSKPSDIKSRYEHGADITVVHRGYGGRRWIIETKGESRKKLKPNNVSAGHATKLISALGEILTRMWIYKGDPLYRYGYKYGVAFPISFSQKALNRIPWAACKKLNLFVLLVHSGGKIEQYDWHDLKKLQQRSGAKTHR